MPLKKQDSFVIHKKWFIDKKDVKVTDVYVFDKKVLLTFNNIENTQALGEGTYGNVYKAVHKKTK